MSPLPDSLLAEDSAARERALAPASFIVEAPAGAGKTELLTQRCLKLLGSVEQPEEVVAITFTNKAAAEMRDRILTRLAGAQHDSPPAEPHLRASWELARTALARDEERGWGLLAHPGRLRVTTIDALCASLARQMPYLSRLGATPAVVTDAEPHYSKAAKQTLRLIEGNDATAEIVIDALDALDNDASALERLLVEMLARRDQWLHHAHRVEGEAARLAAEAGLRRLVEGDLARAAAVLSPMRQALLRPAARFAAAQWAPTAALGDWEADLLGKADELPRWQALAALLIDTKPDFRKSLDARQGFPAANPQAKALAGSLLALLDELRGDTSALPALLAVKKLPSPDLGEDWPYVEIFARLLRVAAAQLWLVFREAGEVDFAEIAFLARHALGSDDAPTDLALALDYRIRHLLVDEFQDTSPSQVDLLACLTRGWQPDDGRTLFVVGDPMQSIYRFRKAEVGLFLKAQAYGIGDVRLESLRLYRNNRSFPAVVDWINRCFTAVLAEKSDIFAGAVAYRPFVAGKGDEPTAGVWFHPVIDSGDAGIARREEAERILELIEATHRERPHARIAVLVRGRDHLAPLVAEIRRRRADIRYLAVEIEALSERQHIQDLISLTRALMHRADRVHWLAMLRAPWCGLTLADLHTVAGGDFRPTIWQCIRPGNPALVLMSPDGQRRLAHVRDILAEALAHRERMPLRRMVEAVWRMLDGPACLVAPGDLDDCQAYFRLLERLEAECQLQPDTLETEAARLYASPDPLADERLQFMTIHKSKGLEFDTVIVPGLDRPLRGDTQPLLVWGELPEGEGDCLLAAPKRKHEGNATPFSYLCAWESTRRAHEDARLLYVAATRAQRCLHWLGVAPLDSEGRPQAPARSLLRLLWAPAAETAFAAASVPESPEDTAEKAMADFIPDLVRLATVRRPAQYSEKPPASPVAATTDEAHDGEGSGLSTGGKIDASVGTLVHRCLEAMALDGMTAWDSTRLHDFRPRFLRWLRQQGHPQDEAEQGTARVLEMLERCLASPTAARVLAPRDHGEAELALSSREEGSVAHHVIDRTFVENGERWIIDYKTARLSIDSEDALAERTEQYRPQLERYARLFAPEGRPLKLAIYFVAHDRLVALPPSA